MLAGCGSMGELNNAYARTETSSNTNNTGDLRIGEGTQKNHPDDNPDIYLDAYMPWQIALAKERGLSEQCLRDNAKFFLGELEQWFGSALNAPIPPQSSLDGLLMDRWLETYGDIITLRSEIAVLLTEQREEIYYSLLVTASEGGGPVLVAWEQNEDGIQILDSRRADYPFSIPPVRPTVAELAGNYVMFSLLHNDAWFGGDDINRRFVHSAAFSVTIGSGAVLTQNVTELPCILLFLPEKEYTFWSLSDIDGKLIWDSLDQCQIDKM